MFKNLKRKRWLGKLRYDKGGNKVIRIGTCTLTSSPKEIFTGKGRHFALSESKTNDLLREWTVPGVITSPVY